MQWPKLEYSKSQVNKAGNILATGPKDFEEFLWAEKVLNNWRSCHGRPINTFQSTLRDKLVIINVNNAIVAQRLKRTPSIISKLKRFKGMQLARMHDIGGLRAVVPNTKNVYELRNNYFKSHERQQFKHDFITEYDYIARPKPTGYRSIHLVYRYHSDKFTDYNGLRVELQIRSKLQHIWATAVETVDTFKQYALKSSQGPDEWLGFFTLCGSGFAHLEKLPPVPIHEELSRIEIFKLIAIKARLLDVRAQLQAFKIAVNKITEDKNKGVYHLVVLDIKEMIVYVRSFSFTRLDEANNEYMKEEKRIAVGEPRQAVLVSTGPIDNLRRAYPNYFLDTDEFLSILQQMIKLSKK